MKPFGNIIIIYQQQYTEITRVKQNISVKQRNS